MSTRPSHDEYFMEIANVVRSRSTCSRGQVGALIVAENHIISTGYNGAPPGHPHCIDVGCDVDDEHLELGCRRAIHAEANAIAWAARYGVSTESATIYCTAGPCLKCAQLILSAGIKEVVYRVPYRLRDGETLLIESGVNIRRLRPPAKIEVLDVSS